MRHNNTCKYILCIQCSAKVNRMAIICVERYHYTPVNTNISIDTTVLKTCRISMTMYSDKSWIEQELD